MGTQRICKTLQLAEDRRLIEEYESRHAPGAVWPEILDGIRSVGIRDMEIYRDGRTLFMIVEMDENADHDAAMARLATLPRQAEWEASMSRYQASDPASPAAEKWRPVKRIFSLSS